MKETGKEKFEDILRCVSFVKPSGAPVRMDVSYIPEGEDHREKGTLEIMVTF